MIDDDIFDAEPIPEPEPRITPESSQLPATPLTNGIRAFHQGEYDDAVTQLEAVLEDREYDEDSKLRASYYRAEALTEKQLVKESIDLFEEMADGDPSHYLSSAARRRADALREYFGIIEGDAEE